IQGVFPIILFALLPFLPESPRYLLIKDRYEEASAVLHKLHTPDEAKIELAQIANQMRIDLINNYGPILYAGLGYGPEKQLIYQAGWMTLGLGAGVLGMLWVDRLPRPKLIALGLAGCIICLIVEAALVAQFVPSDNTPALQAAVAMFFVYVIVYESCLDGTQFVYCGELFPTHLRAKGMNLCVVGITLMNLIWLQVAPVAFEEIGWKYYLCFIICGSVAAIIIWFVFPDTWGVPLEEIAAIFGDEDELYQASIEDGKVESDEEKNEVVREEKVVAK
ncbi:hypothetical protein LTS18_003788, partial [Coniosporium uncinatum]